MVTNSTHSTQLADIFFRADKVLSEADLARTNELRRTYRQWRSGSSVEPHADPLQAKLSASTEETRSRAKMRRVKTYGQLGSASGSDTSSTSPPPSEARADTPRSGLWRGRVRATPLYLPVQALASLAAPGSSGGGGGAPAAAPSAAGSGGGGGGPAPSPKRPILAAGGCPFPQGALPPPVALPTASVAAPASSLLPGGCPFRQPSGSTPPPTELPPARAQGGTSSLLGPTPLPPAPAAGHAGAAPAAGVPPLSAEQLAAFQAAYMKALQEQSVRDTSETLPRHF